MTTSVFFCLNLRFSFGSESSRRAVLRKHTHARAQWANANTHIAGHMTVSGSRCPDSLGVWRRSCASLLQGFDTRCISIHYTHATPTLLHLLPALAAVRQFGLQSPGFCSWTQAVPTATAVEYILYIPVCVQWDLPGTNLSGGIGIITAKKWKVFKGKSFFFVSDKQC